MARTTSMVLPSSSMVNYTAGPPTQLRATMQSYFFPTGIGILISHYVVGLWRLEIFQLYGVSLPGVLLAIALGGWMNQRISVEEFQTFLSILIILLGLLLWF